MIPKHHLSSFFMRGMYSLAAVVFVLILGTVSLHFIEQFSYLDAFYFTSMIATGQGPAPELLPQTAAGKVFISILSFISVGVSFAALGFLFGPFLARLLKVGVHKVEDEIHHLEHKKKK